jgi:hypothetical protein
VVSMSMTLPSNAQPARSIHSTQVSSRESAAPAERIAVNKAP